MEATLEQAIDWLRSNLLVLDSQNDALQKQKETLLSIRRNHETSIQNASVSNIAASDLTKRKAQLDLEIDQSVASLQQTLQQSGQKADILLSTIPKQVDRSLQKDDRMLDGLQKLIPRLEQSQSPISSHAVNELCDQYVSLQRQATRSRLDQVYQDALLKFSTISQNDTQDDVAIRAELNELCGEIDGLVGLNAEHHFRQHISRYITLSDQDAVEERAKWSEYTACVLLYLTAKVEAYDELVRQAHAHKAAMSVVEQEVEKIMAMKALDTARTVTSTPNAVIHKGLKPLRLVQATMSGDQNVTSQLFSLLSISQDKASTDPGLRSALRSRSEKLHRLEIETQEELAELEKESMSKQQQHSSDLLRAIFGNSSFKNAQLVDADVKEQIEALGSKTEEISQGMRGLDVDGIAASVLSSLSAAW